MCRSFLGLAVIVSLLAGIVLAAPAFSADPTLSVMVTDVRDVSFAVTWMSEAKEGGQVNYGTGASLGSTAYNESGGKSFNGRAHRVVVSGLLPKTKYQFEVVSGGKTYPNVKEAFTVTTGSTLSLATPQQVFGQVQQPDGQPAGEGIVYVVLKDGDKQGTGGSAAVMSSALEAGGYWAVDLANARIEDLSRTFELSAKGDLLEVMGVAPGAFGSITTDVSQARPVAALKTAPGSPPEQGSATSASSATAEEMPLWALAVVLVVVVVGGGLVVRLRSRGRSLSGTAK